MVAIAVHETLVASYDSRESCSRFANNIRDFVIGFSFKEEISWPRRESESAPRNPGSPLTIVSLARIPTGISSYE